MDAHVADDLALRFLKGEVYGLLASRAGGIGKGGGEADLARSCRARQQHAAAPVIALAAEHGVEPL